MVRQWRALACVLVAALAAHSAPPTSAQSADLVTFRMIVVSSEEAARELARRARPDNFATLARAESIDPSAEQGGLIGPIEIAALRSELRAALTPLAPGETSAVVRVPTGFAIVQRVDASSAGG